MKKHTTSTLTSLLLAAVTCTSLICFPADSHAATLVTDRLKPEWSIRPGDKLYSANSEFYLTLLNDCNLQIRRTITENIIWASNSAGYGTPKFALMQSDGNFVLYTYNKGAVWATSRFGSGREIRMQDDGNLVVYGTDNNVLWASNSVYNSVFFPNDAWKRFSRIVKLNAFNRNPDARRKVTYRTTTYKPGNRPWLPDETLTVQVVPAIIETAEEAGEEAAELEELKDADQAGAGWHNKGITDGTAFDQASAEGADPDKAPKPSKIATWLKSKIKHRDSKDPCGRTLLGPDGRYLAPCKTGIWWSKSNQPPKIEAGLRFSPNGQMVYIYTAEGAELPWDALFSTEGTVYRAADTRNTVAETFKYGFRAPGENLLNLEETHTLPQSSGYVSTSRSKKFAYNAGDGSYYTIEIPERTGVDYNKTYARREGGAGQPMIASAEEVGVPKRIPREWVKSWTNGNTGETINNGNFKSPLSQPGT